MKLTTHEKVSLKNCLLFGVIGDSIGSKYERAVKIDSIKISIDKKSYTTDDTELTLKTLETIV